MLGNLIEGFPEWGDHSSGMAQHISKLIHWGRPFLELPTHCVVTWTALCAEGLLLRTFRWRRRIN